MESKQKLHLLHIAKAKADPRIWNRAFKQALSDFGTLTIREDGDAMSDAERAELIRTADVLLAGWGSAMCPAEVGADPGRLRYACNITGELKKFFPPDLVEAGIPITNWGNYPADRVAEGALALTLAVLKDIHYQTDHIAGGGWKMDMQFRGGCLTRARLGIYGLGVIGRRYLELIAPFDCDIMIFDPYLAEMPDGCRRADSLEELFDHAQLVAIHAALTPETRHSVTGALLARLPRHGVLINTARGGIVDQDALFAELESGRLRAGLDVLDDPDLLEEGHPARQWPNLILTAHRVDYGWPDFGEEPAELNRMQEICIENLTLFGEGKPLRFAFDRERYARST